MKNIVIQLVFILGLITPSVAQENCNKYSCMIDRVDKAIKNKNFKAAFKDLEAAAGYSDSKSDEVAKFRKRLFDAIEKEKNTAIEAQKGEQGALKLQKKASQEAIIQADSAKSAQKRTELALLKADSALKEVKRLLDTLAQYDNRDYLANLYKISKIKADSFYAISVWDSTHFYYKKLKDIYTISPYIQNERKGDKEKIEERFEKSRIIVVKIDSLKSILTKVEELINNEDFPSLGKAYNTYYQLSKDSISKFLDMQDRIPQLTNKISRKVNKNILNNDSLNLATMYLLLEIIDAKESYKEISALIDTLFMSKEYDDVKRIETIVESVYSLSSVQMYHRGLFVNHYTKNRNQINQKRTKNKNELEGFYSIYEVAALYSTPFLKKTKVEYIGVSSRILLNIEQYSRNRNPVNHSLEFDFSSMKGIHTSLDTFSFIRQNGSSKIFSEVRKKSFSKIFSSGISYKFTHSAGHDMIYSYQRINSLFDDIFATT
jgi:hypothetical protein